MTPVTIDFETRSRVDLRSTSAENYARHPSTRVLCMGYQVGEWPRELWTPGEPFPFADEWPDVMIQAFNAAFEWAVWNGCCTRLYDWPPLRPEQVQCLQARASYAGLPRKLAQLGKPLGMGRLAKDDEGHRNMLRLTKPLKAELQGIEYVGGAFDDAPARHEKVRRYCLQDIRAEGLVARLCPPLSDFEQQVWQANHEINERGVPVDMDLCRTAVRLVEREKARLSARLEEITGIEGITPDGLPKLKTWIKGRGVNLPDMTEATVSASVAGEIPGIPEDVREVLNIRKLCRDASVAKYYAFLNYANAEGRCQGTHIYYKAGPGRFAGAGPQPQNLRRLSEDTLEDRLKLADGLSDVEPLRWDIEEAESWVKEQGEIIPTLGGMVRLAVCAKPGNVLVVSDWSAIEMRALHWLAGDGRTLQQIRDYDAGTGEEPYRIMAAALFSKLVSEVTKAERQIGKVAILGSGYCTGAATFSAFCKGYGIDMPLDRAREIIQIYRRSYPLVKRLWYALNDAAVKAITKGGRHQVGYVEYYMTGSTLNARLPSGREIKYYDAAVVDGQYGPEVEAIDPQKGCRRAVRTPTIVENVDQGTCRDLLAAALLRCRKEGLPVVLHVHDEIVLEVPEKDADAAGKALRDIMCDSPAWARGLPVKVGMGAARRYVK